MIGSKWPINPWEWFPILFLTFLEISEFRPNVGPWVLYVLQECFKTYQRINNRFKEILFRKYDASKNVNVGITGTNIFVF